MTIAIVPHIQTAWHQVGLDYNAGLINSEGCMQAAFYSALRHQLPEGYRVFVEPTWTKEPNEKKPNTNNINGQPTTSVFPDLVVCRNTTIVAVMELKFVPQHYPKFEQDIHKLVGFMCDQTYSVSIEPETGKWPESLNAPYSLSPQALHIFAAIGSIESAAVYPEKTKTYFISLKTEKLHQGQFMTLYGRVNGGIAFFGSDM